MRKFELIAPCHFGLEAVLKKEIIDLGYDVSQVEDGRVTFIGDDEAVCRANIGLRTADRILIKVGSFRAETFDELFENTKILGGKSGKHQEQAVLTVGHTVHYEKGNGGAVKTGLWYQLVFGGGRVLSGSGISDERYRYRRT